MNTFISIISFGKAFALEYVVDFQLEWESISWTLLEDHRTVSCIYLRYN